jgi:hypothetical protein
MGQRLIVTPALVWAWHGTLFVVYFEFTLDCNQMIVFLPLAGIRIRTKKSSVD